MELRDHPLMRYRRVASWPPVWTPRSGGVKVLGEVGVLQDVAGSVTDPHNRLYLYIEKDGVEYIGCLMISDRAFARQIAKMLEQHVGSTIAHIGGLDVSDLL